MAVIAGVFTDKGREWLSKLLAQEQLSADAFVFIRNTRSLSQASLGNQTITDTVTASTFVVSGMDGGVDGAASAFGGITAVTGATLLDGETFTISDGMTSKIFEFDKDGIVTPGRVRVAVTNAMTAEQVAQEIVRAINGAGLLLAASFVSRTDGINFFRIGEGGFRVLPSLEKVPIAPSERKDKNGVQAGKGVKGDLTIDPDTAPVGDQIIVPANGGGGSPGEVPVSDRDTSLFFVQKELAPSDFVRTLVSGVFRVEVTCKLEPDEANERFDSQGGGNPHFFEIGLFARENSVVFMIGYATFPVQVKTNTISLINKVVFEI